MERGVMFMFILFSWLKCYYLLVCLVKKCLFEIFLLYSDHICCGYSKEPYEWDGSFEQPKHMLELINKISFYEGHPINRENFLIMQEFVPLEHEKCNH